MWLLYLFLRHLRFSAACSAAGYPCRVPHLSGSGKLAYSCSGCLLLGWRCLGTPLGFLPCASAASPSAAYPYRVLQPFWLQFAGLLLRWSLVVGLEVSLMCRLVFYHVPCSSSGACGLRSLPCKRFPWGFSAVTGCLSFCFPGDVGWASALPFFLCASPAPAGLQGFAGFCTLCQGAPVGVVSALWTTVSSCCWLSLTLGWVSFWPAVSTVSVSSEVCGLGCPSWFVLLFMSLFVLHLLLGWGGLVTGL